MSSETGVSVGTNPSSLVVQNLGFEGLEVRGGQRMGQEVRSETFERRHLY